MSVSPDAICGFRVHRHLRPSLVFPNVPTMQQPEACIGGATTLFVEDGTISNKGTKNPSELH
jgi:chromate reductase